MNSATNGAPVFHDLHPAPADMHAEILEGLAKPSKSISPKFFYDQHGSQLFDAICELPEYYITRCEIEIYTRYANQIAAATGAGRSLIELGSGSSRKIRLLLDSLQPRAYVALDISREHLLAACQDLAVDHPALPIHAVCVDYSQAFDFPFGLGTEHRLAFFPGSSIGNFEPAAAVALLTIVRDMVEPQGGLLLGIDLKKDPAILERAYSDSAGVTAAFNLNLLARINRELGANFDLAQFHHESFYNTELGRIEMHLISDRRQTVHIGQQTVHFAAGERLHTENSYKYQFDDVYAMARRAGYNQCQHWCDTQGMFGVFYLSC